MRSVRGLSYQRRSRLCLSLATLIGLIGVVATKLSAVEVSGPYRFKILVDVNQLMPNEATQAERFAADGVLGYYSQ